MATHGRGLICLSLTGAQVERLGLPMMSTHNQSAYNTAFTVSIEAREGVTTGISAADRALTTLVAIDPKSTAKNIVIPGHMFPLRARDGGVLTRVGQTEGSVDLARIGDMNPSAVICEIMRPDGTMARLPDLIEFGQLHSIRVVAVADIIKWRMRNERIVRREADGSLEIPGLGTWNTRLYRGLTHGGMHMAVWKGDLDRSSTLARVQGAPPPWSFLDAKVSSLARPARAALERIDGEGRGVLVMMHLGGVSDDTLARNFCRDFEGEAPAPAQATAEALRDLGMGCQILSDLGLCELRLLTNSRRNIVGVEAYGLRVGERVALGAI